MHACSRTIHQQSTSSYLCVITQLTIGFYFRKVSHVNETQELRPHGVAPRSRPLRVLIAAESFLPHVNGVTNSVLRTTEYLTGRGHHVSIVAPSPGKKTHFDVQVHRVRAVGLPGYRDVRVAMPTYRIAEIVRAERPDVVHLAAPFVLGAAVLRQCRREGIPTVAVYQTDVAGFARDYHLRGLSRVAWKVTSRIHNRADITLAPSSSAVADLRRHRVIDVVRWMRGVDVERFNPSHRNDVLRKMFGGNQRIIVGYVGRLAREKRLELLAPLAQDPRFSVVIVGDGPSRASLKKLMPSAYFMGFSVGRALSELHASFDLFVHTGLSETFCQAIQEALASGVPVVAPGIGGPLDLVVDGRNGLLWNPTDPTTLIDAVNDLAINNQLRLEMAGRARESVVNRTWDSVMAELEEHYYRLCPHVSGELRGAA